MSQSFEDYARQFCVRCADIGLVCNCVVFGDSEEKVMENTIKHMFELHAINPLEMTSCMRLKIRENTHISSVKSLSSSENFPVSTNSSINDCFE
jgi:predicted small metal-binding protein